MVSFWGDASAAPVVAVILDETEELRLRCNNTRSYLLLKNECGVIMQVYERVEDEVRPETRHMIHDRGR